MRTASAIFLALILQLGFCTHMLAKETKPAATTESAATRGTATGASVDPSAPTETTSSASTDSDKQTTSPTSSSGPEPPTPETPSSETPTSETPALEPITTESTKTPAHPSTSPLAKAQPTEAEKAIRDGEYKEGVRLYQTKKYAEAIKHLQKAAASTADDGEAKIMLGYSYYSLKQYDAALKAYHLAAEKSTLISVRNRAGKLERTLNCYMRGICPGNCLKPSTPGWRKMNVPGKPDRLVWMVFPYLDPAGKGGSEYWSNDHMGEVIEYVNGRPVDRGRCPICNGTGKVLLAK